MTSWRYTLTMFIAIATCGWLLRRSQKSLPMPRWQKTALGAAAFCGAMVGSKIPFVFGPVATLSLTHWMADGKTIMCGIVGGYFAVEWTKWMLDIRTKTGDSFAMPVAIAVGIGRLACFQGGCCYGQPTDLPWGIGFPTADGSLDVPRHPTQLYEAAFHFAAATAMYQWAARGLFRGQLLKLYLIAYFIFRFFTEFLRPEPIFAFGWTWYQWACLVLLPIFAALWFHDARMLADKPAARENANAS